MYVVESAPERVPKVYLHCQNGVTRVFASVWDLCHELPRSWILANVGGDYRAAIKIVTKRASGLCVDKNFRVYYSSPEEFHFVSACFIIRTDEGEAFTAEKLEPYFSELRKARWRGRKKNFGKRYCYGHWRSPQTTNEMRSSFHNEEEGEPPVRCRRNRKHLPTVWNDIYTHSSRSWKLQSKRKRQYKIKLK